jgi:sugar lactone lactonase YvrE
VTEFDRRKQLRREPIQFLLEREKMTLSALSFPGKVLADEKAGRLFIADSNHNRILVTSLEGVVKHVAGSGEAGLRDGSFENAAFFHPQGLALDGDLLYVADTENHALRRLDLRNRTVATVAGTGEQAPGLPSPGPGLKTALNSPWDLAFHRNVLYVAMAGSHQIWTFTPKTGQMALHAGSGQEGRTDGPLAQAALAQPSGLATDGKKLYFSDSEVSAVRSADMDPQGRVETLVGLDLFEFGDRDGTGQEARLQHPLGVAFHNGVLYVADTYNNKIKRLDPETKTCVTLWGTGRPGLEDGTKPLFDEPGGLSAAGGRLFIADTNNHAVRVADLATKEVLSLGLQGIDPPAKIPAGAGASASTMTLEPQSLAPGIRKLSLKVQLPKGTKLDAQAPSQASFIVLGNGVRFEDGKSERKVLLHHPHLVLPLRVQEGLSRISCHLTLYYCAEKESLCQFKEARLELPVQVSPQAPASRELHLQYVLSLDPEAR